jgi:hypothetical protein
MTCQDFEKLIALDVESDLPKQNAGGLAEHLRTCPHCREFERKLQASQALLKELGQEAPDEAALREVRRGILSRLPSEAGPKAYPVWQFALGAGLVTLLIFAAIIFMRPPRTPVKRTMARVQTPMATEATRRTPAPPPPSPARHPKKVRAVTARKSSASALRASAKRQPEPLMVKLFTDNPNVVIYWQID